MVCREIWSNRQVYAKGWKVWWISYGVSDNEEASKNINEMGEHHDPQHEQEVEDCEKENLLMHPDYVQLDPDQIEIDNIKTLREQNRHLDFYQRRVLTR